MKRLNFRMVFAGVLCACMAALSGPMTAGAAKGDKDRTVRLKITGPEDAARQLREAFEKAADRNHWIMTDDSHKAGISMEIKITDAREKEIPIYAELLSATHESNGLVKNVYVCRSIADSKGKSPKARTTTDKVLLPPFPGENKKVFIQADKGRLSDSVGQRLTEAGYEIVPSEQDAAIRLANLSMIQKTIRVMVQPEHIETTSLILGARSNFTTDVKRLNSIVEPLDPEAEACRDNIKSLFPANAAGYESVVELQMYLLNKSLSQ